MGYVDDDDISTVPESVRYRRESPAHSGAPGTIELAKARQERRASIETIELAMARQERRMSRMNNFIFNMEKQ